MKIVRKLFMCVAIILLFNIEGYAKTVNIDKCPIGELILKCPTSNNPKYLKVNRLLNHFIQVNEEKGIRVINIEYFKITPKLYKIEISSENMMNGTEEHLTVGFTIEDNYAIPTYFGFPNKGVETTNIFECNILCVNIFYQGISLLN
ncbi:hypothetical protein Bwad004_28890 [Bilophila wadsworthia]